MGRPGEGVDLNVAVRNYCGPKNVSPKTIAAVDRAHLRTIAGVNIVGEIDVVLEVRLTSIDIQSDFEESSGVEAPVDSPIDAFHKAQIGVPEEAVVGFTTLVADAVALNANAAVEADKVRNLVRLIS